MQKYLAIFVLLLCFCMTETSCSQISLTKKTKHNLIPELSNEQFSTANSSARIGDLSGEWAIGFRVHGASTAGVMRLKQNGQNFYGYGKDGEKGPTFKIERGTVHGNEIIFLKRYENESAPPLQYHGQLSLLPNENGGTPYMGGNFEREAGNNILTGEWEAMKKPAAEEQAAVKEPPTTEAPPIEPSVPEAATHTPDLSGKWEVAFEYNFKIIHSTIFLEQDGSRLGGHGTDKETSAKFNIKKGLYNFPHVSFTRQYLATKKGGHTIPEHEMTFKADVSMVNDSDYQGPYLSGKTQGGGSWEGQRDN